MKKMKGAVMKKRRLPPHHVLITCASLTCISLLIFSHKFADLDNVKFQARVVVGGVVEKARAVGRVAAKKPPAKMGGGGSVTEKECATVEEMGESFGGGVAWQESLRLREIVLDHFHDNGASRVRRLDPEQFCRHGFVLGKAFEAGFGNEMYKILTAAALSMMLNRSLIIGQTRGKYPFGDYISYSNVTFTLKEVKHLWRHNGCVAKYGRHLVMRVDDFQKPSHTNILCSNWMEWEQPILWLQNTTDAVAAQFFLKNVHPDMRKAASNLFGEPEDLQHRANVFGELMRVLIRPSEQVSSAVNWVLGEGMDPDIALHMRMLMKRSPGAIQAALGCIRSKSMQNARSRLRVVVVSDTPSLVTEISKDITQFAEVLRFDYKLFRGNISGKNGPKTLGFRAKDWGPAPRWVAFVDFFLASRAKHAVISGASRRIGTTYAQLIAALAAANALEDSSAAPDFQFLSSFQNDLLTQGLRKQAGWSHAWNRFSGPLSCQNQSNQCAITLLLPPTWWDGVWQSPILRDVQKMKAYGIKLLGLGKFNEKQLVSSCRVRKDHLVIVPVM